ncbi:MAG TPA: TonB family protein [Candidatus Tumulicola sp.]|jgi:protein TonB
MKLGRNPQRLLLLAFAISLLVHVIFALVVRLSRGTTPTGVEVVTIEHRSAIFHLQTPPPRPKATPVPHPRPSSRPAPKSTQGARTAGSGGGRATPTPEPTAAPTPVAVASAAACAKSDIAAAVIEDPPQPDVPNAARAEGTSGIATIAVRLDAQGTVTDASVSRGTGNSSLDLVALAMARAARYSPALRDCKPIAADYAYSVKFVAW